METRQEKRDQMFSIIRDYLSGTETQLVFCDRVGIKIHCFQYWLSKYKKTQALPSGFIQLSAAQNNLPEEIELHFPNGVSVRLGRESDIHMVSQLIRLW